MRMNSNFFKIVKRTAVEMVRFITNYYRTKCMQDAF